VFRSGKAKIKNNILTSLELGKINLEGKEGKTFHHMYTNTKILPWLDTKDAELN